MSVLQKERDLKAKLATATAKAREVTQKAEADNRVLTAEERAEIDGHLKDAREIKASLDQLGADRDLREQIAQLHGAAEQRVETAAASRPAASRQASLGEQFVQSEAYGWIQDSKRKGRPSNWTSPGAELFDASMHAATLTEDAASGGDLITPDYRPGILPLLFKRLTVADLLASGRTDSNLISYMKETTFTNAAAPVAEGGTKPESTLIFDAATSPVQKIAHWLPVTDEMLEDVAQIRSYIDSRLRLGVELTEEDQLLNGSGTPPALTGLMSASGLTTAVARGTDTNMDAIFKQITAIQTSAFIMPDAIVMNPANWQTVQLGKDANGQYFGSGPFSNAQTPTLWGLRVVVTPSIVANTALVGAYKQCAQVFRKGGIRVEASNSHASYFITNLTAIRAEERLALAIYRPAGFGKVTGLA